ncbi:MAG: sugar ABC transporter permease [Candidatus Limnocylindria bacterium]
MSDVPPTSRPSAGDRTHTVTAWVGRRRQTGRALVRLLDVDTRLLGLIAAMAIIWIGFNIASGGTFLTARNLWNLSVQSASIAIMATGMVLIIVARQIDLSVGSLLGFIGYSMAMAQTVWLPQALGLGLEHPATWILVLAIGLVLGAILGGIQGFIVAYGGIPSFIVTLGGLLVWRGLIFQYAQGQTIAPLDSTFRLLGGGPEGSLGEIGSWAVGAVACAAVVIGLVLKRRRRSSFGFQVRPWWAVGLLSVVACAIVLAAVWVTNAYPWPEALAADYALEHGIAVPPGGLVIPTGIAYPVLIMIAVAILMTHLAERRRFGRNVYAIGGNPVAAELSGINTKRTVMLTFAVMGVLAAVSAAVQTARLNAAVTGLGVQNELDVISAAVIGGTSFTGGVGTIPGAILGAVVMQSLRSGMVLLRVDSPTQDIVVGIVLVAAVGVDAWLRRRQT